MDPLAAALVCGVICAIAVILEHVAVPRWYPEDWGILGTHGLGTATLGAGLLGWGVLTGHLPVIGAPTLGAATAGTAAVAAGIAWCRARRPPVALTGYAPVPFYIGGTLVFLAGLWLLLPAPLAAAGTVILAGGGAGTLLAYGVRWRSGRAAQRRLRRIFGQEEGPR